MPIREISGAGRPAIWRPSYSIAPDGTHRVGRARHQHLALVHHGDSLRKTEHAIDVVLDDQYRNVRGHVLDQVRHAFALGGGEASQRLIEQQHLWFGAERDPQVHQTLPAIGQFAAFDLLDAFETEEFYQFGGFGVNLRIAVDIAPDVEAHRMPRLQRKPQVLVDRQAAEQVGDLERAREAAMADKMRGQALNLAAIELHDAGVGGVQTGHQVEQGRLAGAVRSDQSVDFAGFDRQAGTGDRANSAELFRNVLDPQHRSLQALRQ